MVSTIFSQTNIAIIWDFDKTLIPGYMQEPLFKHYNVDGRTFWREVNALPDHLTRKGQEMVAADSIYLNHILTYVRAGIFKGLNNRLLRELGGELEFYPGLPEFSLLSKSMWPTIPFTANTISKSSIILSALGCAR